MKKLMIMAAVMGAAVAAQALTTWQFSMNEELDPIKTGYKAAVIGGSSGDTIGAGYNVYIISSASDTEGYFVSQDNLLSGLRSGKSITAVAGNALIATTTTKNNGYINAVSMELDEKFYAKSEWSDFFADYDKVSAYFAIVVGNDVLISNEAADCFRGSPEVNFDAYNSNTRIDTAEARGGYSTAGWYAISAPEPTSGLLMLLGFAGLALRRKSNKA